MESKSKLLVQSVSELAYSAGILRDWSGVYWVKSINKNEPKEDNLIYVRKLKIPSNHIGNNGSFRPTYGFAYLHEFEGTEDSVTDYWLNSTTTHNIERYHQDEHWEYFTDTVESAREVLKTWKA